MIATGSTLKHLSAVLSVALLLMLLISSPNSKAQTSNAQNNNDNTTSLYQHKIDAAIEMLQSTDPQAVSRYIDAELHPDTLKSFGGDGRTRYIAYVSDIKLFHGSLSLLSDKNFPDKKLSYEITRPEPLQLSARVRSANTELDYQLRLDLSAEAPVKITNIDIVYVPAPAAANNNLNKLNKQQLAQQLSAYVDRLAQRGTFSGVVLLSDQNGVLYQSAKGMADLRYQVPNNTDTKFNLASMNKMFTAISILQLAEAKKLSLTDKLVRYIDPALFAKGDFDQITIQQLLSHTSGLGWPAYPDTHPNNVRNLNDYRPLLKHLPLNAKPGSRFGYSNEGMLLLGMVIEQVSGLSYDDYVQQHIYAKAGMTQSGNFDIDGVTPNMAMGYFYSHQLKSMQSNWFIQGIKGNAAGGGYSTIHDLHKFATALTSYQLLSPELTQLAYSAKPELNSPNYGYGFSVRSTANGQVIGHAGDFIGVSSALRIYLDKGFTLVVLANQSFASEPVINKANLLLQQL